MKKIFESRVFEEGKPWHIGLSILSTNSELWLNAYSWKTSVWNRFICIFLNSYPKKGIASQLEEMCNSAVLGGWFFCFLFFSFLW